MLVLNSHITIGDLRMNFVNEITIESGWELLTDTCNLILPSNIRVSTTTASASIDAHSISKHIKAGHPVIVETGYGENLNRVFEGYVTKVSPKTPMLINCEDEMWQLKQQNIKDSGKAQGLTSLLKKHFPNYEILALDVELGKYYIDNISGAKFLESLKKDFGLFSFFRGKTLVVGHRYYFETATKHKFKFNYNIISDNLEFKTKEDVKVKITAISNNADGTKTEVEFGDANGDSRTLNFFNLSEKELRAAAEREKTRLVYDGYRGSFETFGYPIVRHGDIVELIHANESDKTGTYWVDKVEYKFGVGGYRQVIHLGART